MVEGIEGNRVAGSHGNVGKREEGKKKGRNKRNKKEKEEEGRKETGRKAVIYTLVCFVSFAAMYAGKCGRRRRELTYLPTYLPSYLPIYLVTYFVLPTKYNALLTTNAAAHYQCCCTSGGECATLLQRNLAVETTVQ